MRVPVRTMLLVAAYVAAVAAIAVVVVDRVSAESASIPRADVFSFPVGDPATGAGAPVVAAFCESGGGRGHHIGLDAGVVDVQVHAAADGRVVTAGFRGGWDGVVLIEHRLESGKTVYTQYGHLQKVEVKAGQDVERGETIGVSGPPGDGAAEEKHLHFEVKTLPTIGSGWSAGGCPPSGYLDPTAFVRSSRPGA